MLSLYLLGHLSHVETASETKALGNTVKPLNIIVITNGRPTDDVETVISNAANRLDKCNAKPWQVGIQFVQVGNDSKATKWLKKLDDTFH
ncbi:hypothetical protein PAAG_05341 [Paracoccidioides lutzii Pb01]|uniref:Uncharacterized protein n=1 Tax=Paracoccidioides lutzii (strain ATCC MYA-826 / Pb01) TaxID=502779 RepID=C1H3J8_PARBA|nr:hypothetical protein PAAG_05341 [Paracoccidioides lutzii Pb01]EEH34292.2 hypothetical protein PAAG_05341 [Paracoccidioides lutzii Pb01]